MKENYLINLMKQQGVRFVDKAKIKSVLKRKITGRKPGQKPDQKSGHKSGQKPVQKSGARGGICFLPSPVSQPLHCISFRVARISPDDLEPKMSYCIAWNRKYIKNKCAQV